MYTGASYFRGTHISKVIGMNSLNCLIDYMHLPGVLLSLSYSIFIENVTYN
jgi:hypothetical protein